jgi:hypothetical protein
MAYFFLLPISILVTLLAYLLAPVTALFVRKDGTLPYPLSYLGTTDNSNWGDEGHEVRWKFEHSYMQACAWLFRNPAYGFEWDGPLAAKVQKNTPVSLKGNPQIKNRTNAVAGWYFCTVGDYWNFKAVIPLWGDLAFMPEFGWKLQEFAQGKPYTGKAMYVFSLRFTAFHKQQGF